MGILPPLSREIHRYKGAMVKRIVSCNPMNPTIMTKSKLRDKYKPMVNSLDNETVLLSTPNGKIPVSRMLYVDKAKGISIQSQCEEVILKSEWNECSEAEKHKVKCAR